MNISSMQDVKIKFILRDTDIMVQVEADLRFNTLLQEYLALNPTDYTTVPRALTKGAVLERLTDGLRMEGIGYLCNLVVSSEAASFEAAMPTYRKIFQKVRS